MRRCFLRPELTDGFQTKGERALNLQRERFTIETGTNVLVFVEKRINRQLVEKAIYPTQRAP
jgi:hypothetical protein